MPPARPRRWPGSRRPFTGDVVPTFDPAVGHADDLVPLDDFLGTERGSEPASLVEFGGAEGDLDQAVEFVYAVWLHPYRGQDLEPFGTGVVGEGHEVAADVQRGVEPGDAVGAQVFGHLGEQRRPQFLGGSPEHHLQVTELALPAGQDGGQPLAVLFGIGACGRIVCRLWSLGGGEFRGKQRGLAVKFGEDAVGVDWLAVVGEPGCRASACDPPAARSCTDSRASAPAVAACGLAAGASPARSSSATRSAKGRPAPIGGSWLGSPTRMRRCTKPRLSALRTATRSSSVSIEHSSITTVRLPV